MGLFEEFEKVSTQDWVEKIKSDLKGKDYNDTLVWNSNEGIAVQPFYNENPSTSIPLKKSNDWKIRETISIESIENANKKALMALKGGANSILFVGEITNQQEVDSLLKDIQTDIIEIHFQTPSLNQFFKLLPNINGSISYDFLGEYLISENWINSKEKDIQELIDITNAEGNIKSLTVKTPFLSNIGYTCYQQIAVSLSQAVEYFNLLTDKGIETKTLANKIQFTFGIGSNYFFEIAKLRAVRKLWELVLESYEVSDSNMFIHTETSIADFSNDDNNYNILRNTTKAMSAIIGGCDSLTVLPHDNETNDFSYRIARNIQHILKEEAFFDKVSNPADGSYYVEQLTDEIAQKAWELFQEIEKQGGFIACVDNGFIKNQLIKTDMNA